MKKNVLILLVSFAIVLSCNTEPDPYLISKQSIGLLTDSTQVKDLKQAFPLDSIAKNISGDEFLNNTNDINIYDSNGDLSLVLTPSTALDSTAVIKIVKVLNQNYHTKEGLSPISTFKDIRDNYKIGKIQNSIRSVIVSTKDINAFFVIDKEELPAELRFDMSLNIDALQIPGKAEIKNFFLQWN
jgi:hypothetical protein